MMRPNINVRRGGGRIRGTKNQNPLQLDGRQVFGLVVVSVFVLSFLINSTPAIDTSVLLQNTTIFTNDKEGTAAMVSPKAGPASVTVTTTAPKAAASNTDTNANKRQTSRVIISTFVYGEAAMNSKRMRFFLKSVATSGLDYVMMGDAPPQFPLPPNVIHVTKTWNDLVDDIQKGIFHPQEQEQEQKQYQTLFDELKTAKVNKVNDFKPLFAFLYPHLVEGYDWWGWSDNDMLIGDVMKFLNTDNKLDNFDVICGNPKRQSWGPFQLFRNRPDINTLFRESGKPMNQSLIVMKKSMIFDEWGLGGYFEDSMAGIIKRNEELKGIRVKRGLSVDKDDSGWYRDTGECQFKYHGKDKIPPRCGEVVLYPNGTLIKSLTGDELWFAHFRTSKKNHDPSVDDPQKFDELLQPDRPLRVTFLEGFDYVDPNDPRPLT